MAIYLDHNATTPVHPSVLEAMLPFLGGTPGNPSSVHRFGRAARGALDRAREQVAALVNADPGEVLFTSGGTESNNQAVLGLTAGQAPGNLAVSRIEHDCVIQPARLRARQGWTLSWIEVDGNGRAQVPGLEAVLREDTRVAVVMLANNESGVIQDVGALAAVTAERGIPLHTDAAQAAGKIPVDFRALGVQSMTLSSHKLYGPQGVGALIVDKHVEPAALLLGGGQERALRAGTHNLAGVVGFGAACELAATELDARQRYMGALRDALEARLAAHPGLVFFSQSAPRLPNTTEFAVRGFTGETLVMSLDRRGFAVSSGSACHSGLDEPSHVLRAMGIADDLALGAVRVSVGMGNSRSDIDAFAGAISAILDRVPASVRLATGV
jgi:cysteine desulfurase